ncbi:MAG: hypothetical protein ACOWWM_11430 [Desulfobacterales bacterium]
MKRRPIHRFAFAAGPAFAMVLTRLMPAGGGIGWAGSGTVAAAIDSTAALPEDLFFLRIMLPAVLILIVLFTLALLMLFRPWRR